MWFGKRYKILNEIGEGGIFQSFKCIDTELDKIVFVKTLRKELYESNTHEKLFESDFLNIRQLNHPNVPSFTIFDLPEENRKIMVQEEFLEDCYSLDVYLDQIEDSKDLNIIILQLGDVIDYINENGILHNDIQPRNIIITEDLKVYLIDFGNASPIIEKQNLNKTFGNIDFLSPELLQGNQSRYSDIYSFGIILYLILAGELPFKGTTYEAKLVQKTYDEAPLHKINSDEQKMIISKALAINPEKRYNNARTLANEFIASLNQTRKKPNVNTLFLDKIQKIKDYISKDRLKEAINQLNVISKSIEERNSVSMLSASFNEIENQSLHGTEDQETIRINKNKLRHSLIKFTDSIRMNYLKEISR